MLSREAIEWTTPDTPADLQPIAPPATMLVGRRLPVRLRAYSVRQREAAITVNWYSRKRKRGVPSYGITVPPEVALELARKLKEEAEKVMRRKGIG